MSGIHHQRLPVGHFLIAPPNASMETITTVESQRDWGLSTGLEMGGGAGGFDRFVRFINKLADFMIPVGAAFSVLGLIWGGLLFQAGDQRAGRVLGLVALGVGIVLMSKPIAA